MAEYKLDRKDKAFIKGLESFFSLNPEKLTPEEINEINNTPVKTKLARKYLSKSRAKVTVTTYVIPVNEGAVTAYYFVNPKISEINGRIPLMVFFHGGGWIYGNMDFYSIFLRHLAAVTECAILLIDYRLAPRFKFPTAVEDCYDAYIWAYEGAKYWKVDPDRVFIAGDGIGGTMASVVSMMIRDRKGPQPAGQILLYPLTDCRLRTQSMVEHKDSPTLNEKMLSYYVKSFEREPKDILSPIFSPLLSQDFTRLPPALIIAAENDPLKDDAVLYKEALVAGDSEAAVFIAQGAFNGFMPFKDAKGREETEGAIWQFLNGRTASSVQFFPKKIMKNASK
ncbi:MAG: alpha/beta hydrolase [Spirochaetales bacterium]|nr:alpha/beta hydrolase [Spirochaetales bacterium]